jgi:hypothetical protein
MPAQSGIESAQGNDDHVQPAGAVQRLDTHIQAMDAQLQSFKEIKPALAPA